MQSKVIVTVLAISVLGGFLYAPAAIATSTDVDFSGDFVQDNDVALFAFTMDATQVVTAFSSSWLCGDCGLGFDPILAIWNADTGAVIAQQDDGGNAGTTFSNGVGYDHGVWDTWFQISLGPGNYFASIQQFDNFALGANLVDGFVHDADPHFTTAFGPQADFNGLWSGTDGRTSNWEFHVLGVASASLVVQPGSEPIPEPASMVLLILGLTGIAARQRRRKA